MGDTKDVLKVIVDNKHNMTISVNCEDEVDFLAEVAFAVAGVLKCTADKCGGGAEMFEDMRKVLAVIIVNDIYYEFDK